MMIQWLMLNTDIPTIPYETMVNSRMISLNCFFLPYALTKMSLITFGYRVQHVGPLQA